MIYLRPTYEVKRPYRNFAKIYLTLNRTRKILDQLTQTCISEKVKKKEHSVTNNITPLSNMGSVKVNERGKRGGPIIPLPFTVC